MVSALYRVAVCEDEAILCANLCAQCESILDKLKVEHRITSFSSAEKLENALLAGEEFSLLCLDILMGGKSGMKLAQELRQRDDKTSILFITSSTEFLKDGYSVRPIQYLLKPVQAAELEQAITTDLRLYHRPSTVTFHAGGKTLVIPTEDIYYAESREHGTVLHMTHGEKFLPLSLSQTEGILLRFTFLPLPQQLSRKSFPHLRRGRSDSVPDGWQRPCHWAAIYGAFSESICPIPQPKLNTFDFTSEKCGISRLEDAAFSRLIVY